MPKNSIKLAYKVHRYLGIFVAIQILLWIAGGVVMSVIPIENVRGNHLATKVLNKHQDYDYQYSVDRLLLRVEQVSKVEFGELLGQPVYRIYTRGQNYVFDAASGAQLSPLNQEFIQQLAMAHYQGDGALTSLEKLDKTPGQKPPQWRASFNDLPATELYFSEQSGKLLKVRSRIWYFYDFFWMLHIMDYKNARDFNNPLLISFAISSLLFVISGIILLINFIRKKLIKTKRP